MAQLPSVATGTSLAGKPFIHLSFVGPATRWDPPEATTYAQASDIGATCGRELVQWLRDNPGAHGQAFLIWTLADVYRRRADELQTGYRAGFVSRLADAITGYRAGV